MWSSIPQRGAWFIDSISEWTTTTIAVDCSENDCPLDQREREEDRRMVAETIEEEKGQDKFDPA